MARAGREDVRARGVVWHEKERRWGQRQHPCNQSPASCVWLRVHIARTGLRALVPACPRACRDPDSLCAAYLNPLSTEHQQQKRRRPLRCLPGSELLLPCCQASSRRVETNTEKKSTCSPSGPERMASVIRTGSVGGKRGRYVDHRRGRPQSCWPVKSYLIRHAGLSLSTAAVG